MKTTALLLACALSMGIYAQNDKQLHDFERDTIVLSQVVVTGTRTPKTLADAPVATRVITSKDIERTDATDIQDLLTQELPGVEFSYAMNQQTHLNFSGFGGQSILFLVDGERLAGETMDDVDFSRLLMAGVERIEIVKGAASALYGSNAEGGVVNIITKENGGRHAVLRVLHQDRMRLHQLAAKSLSAKESQVQQPARRYSRGHPKFLYRHLHGMERNDVGHLSAADVLLRSRIPGAGPSCDYYSGTGQPRQFDTDAEKRIAYCCLGAQHTLCTGYRHRVLDLRGDHGP